MNRVTMLILRFARWCSEIAGVLLLGMVTILCLVGFGSGMVRLNNPASTTIGGYFVEVVVFRILFCGCVAFAAGLGTYREIVGLQKIRRERKRFMNNLRSVGSGRYTVQVIGETRRRLT